MQRHRYQSLQKTALPPSPPYYLTLIFICKKNNTITQIAIVAKALSFHLLPSYYLTLVLSVKNNTKTQIAIFAKTLCFHLLPLII